MRWRVWRLIRCLCLFIRWVFFVRWVFWIWISRICFIRFGVIVFIVLNFWIVMRMFLFVLGCRLVVDVWFEFVFFFFFLFLGLNVLDWRCMMIGRILVKIFGSKNDWMIK